MMVTGADDGDKRDLLFANKMVSDILICNEKDGGGAVR